MIPAGKQLAIMILSSDAEFTLVAPAGAKLTVDASRTSFAIPVVGGLDALTRAAVIRQVP